MTLRKVFFWLHLIAGCVAGTVILIMSVSGVLLMYEKQIIAWSERGPGIKPPDGAARMPVESLIEKARQERKSLPATVAVSADPLDPLVMAYGREGAVAVNPYTGEVVNRGASWARDLFRMATEWHRYLGATGESRPTARMFTGASNLAFLFIVASGVYLWWPNAWGFRHIRPITWFKRGLPGKARDFNWHNTAGFWSAIPLFFVVLGAVPISFPWASNLVYRLAGTEPPAAQAKGGDEGKKAGAGKGGAKAGARAQSATGQAAALPPPDLNLAGMDVLLQRATSQVNDWKTITLRLPATDRAPVVFTIDRGYAGQPQKRGTLTLDRETGNVRRWETYADMDAGRQWRTWLRFVHTGEYYGLAGQTVAGIASAGGALLVYTGISLAVRRLWAWRRRRSAGAMMNHAKNEETVLVE